MYCDNCGSEITENMKFCRMCGVKIEAFDAVKQPVDQQELVKAAFKDDPNVEVVKIITEPVTQAHAGWLSFFFNFVSHLL